MILLPAIDLVGGRCVRLAQGDFARETHYADDPSAALAAFAEDGASEAHVVDLDGARAREPRQHALLARLGAQRLLHLQVAGGFRTIDQVRRMLDAGVHRVVIGSLAIDDSDAVSLMIEEVGPERLTLAIDVWVEDGTPYVATHGWAIRSGESLGSLLSRFPQVRHLLVTDISRDGMLEGPNLALMREIARQFPAIALQASGGVAALSDLAALKKAGASRAVVGKAIWEGRFSVSEAVARADG